MELENFYSQYSNLPLGKRRIKLNSNSLNMTMKQIYDRLSELEDWLRPLKIEEKKLLKEAKQGFINLERKK